MASLTIERETLGEKRRNYNVLVNEAIKNNPTQNVAAINYEEPDLDNLYKIDLACNNKNFEYVIEVLKGGDMLYVSRAIKQSTWLITDKQYESIINPEYLHLSLYPLMARKAFNKLVLHIRLNLKDEKRVEDFFNYYKQNNLQNALKWLPGCSIPFIENITQEHADDIPHQILKRLYKKSIKIFDTFIRSYKSYYKNEKILPAMFYIKRNTGKFLDIIETCEMYNIPDFGPKYTKAIMKKDSERIMKNLKKYINKLDIPTFAKFVKKENAKDFILTNLKNKETRSLFHHSKIKYFLNRLPVEERYGFIHRCFIEKSMKEENIKDETWDDVIQYCCPPSRNNISSKKNVCCWFTYAPFDKALGDLKQLIRSESNPNERIFILFVLVICAGSSVKNIRALLKYYRESHINEPFKFKIQFVNHLLTKTDAHKYDKETWGYLNDLFNSMEVYSKSDKNVQSCVKAIILRNLINDESVPEIIQQKFEFKNFEHKSKFNTYEREKIFNFLYNSLISKINDDCNTEKKFDENQNIIVKVLNLLKYWDKDLQDYTFILQKIKHLVIVRKENGWGQDLSGIFNIKKSWRKLLFTESILLSPNDESCYNALKHNLQLIEIYKNEINNICINDNKLLKRFLQKTRIYYHQSLAKSFTKLMLENLNQMNNPATSMKGLCILLSRKEMLHYIHKYSPTEPKIDWSQTVDLKLCFRKYIAKYMHLIRPQPPLAVALDYAKGDYLQFVLPSLNAILYNISASSFINEHLTGLLNAPVSLQKHGIRVAFLKLNLKELKKIFSEIWKSSKNSTIRNEIFCQTFKMLCLASDETSIREMWELLSIFMDKLTFDENKHIYVTLSKADQVPFYVRAAFWMKSYEFLQKLKETNPNISRLIYNLKMQMQDLYEYLEIDFMTKIFFVNFAEKLSTQRYEYSDTMVLAVYLLSAKNETEQIERCEKILLPLLEKALTTWDVQYNSICYTQYNLRKIFSEMSSALGSVVLNKKIIFPVAMYTAASEKLQNSLSAKDNYLFLTIIKLSLGYTQILHDLNMKKEQELCFDSKDSNIQDQDDKWVNPHSAAASVFGKLCLGYLEEDVAKYFPSIYYIFADILGSLLHCYFAYYPMGILKVLNVFVDNKDFIEGQLLVLKLLPRYLRAEDVKAVEHEIINKISSHPSEEVAMHYLIFRKEYNKL